MKKIIALLISIVLVASSLTACSDVKTTQQTLALISEFANSPEGTKVLEGIFAAIDESSDEESAEKKDAEKEEAAKTEESAKTEEETKEETAKETKEETAKETEKETEKTETAKVEVTAIDADDEKIINDIVGYFMPLTKIPRQSGHEEEVSEYLFNWAKERGFDPKTDEENNVIFDVPGTEGMEKAPLTILQGHMDMVIAVAEGKTFDPQKDPITVINDGATLKADGTSLGADDGMGVATALYIIENNKSHGPLRVIITTNEEDGMDGATALTKEDVAGAKYVINIDSENSNEVTNSSAASVIVEFTNKLDSATPTKKKAMDITISGLLGGHSGIDIDKCRVNGIKAMGALLGVLDYYKVEYELASIEGGSANNAIPTKATTKIVYDAADEAEIKKIVEHFKEVLKVVYSEVEEDFDIKTKSCDVPKKVLTASGKANLIRFVYGIQDGVYSMSEIVEGLVESSSNLGLISMDPEKSETGTASTYIRSSNADKLAFLTDNQLKLAKDCKIEAKSSTRAEPWPVNPDSKLVEMIQTAYYQETGTDIAVVQIHAGLETGVFAKLDPKLDIVSVGLDIKNPHTINETCYLATLPTVSRMLERVLSEIGNEKK